MVAVPIYRAKKIDSDDYFIGNLCEDYKLGGGLRTWCIQEKYSLTKYEIDISTLSIHFPNTSSTQSEKVWYNMEEISNIIKDYENGKVETD